MSKIIDVSDRLARFTDGNSQTHFWWKDFVGAGATATAGRMTSMWLIKGKPGAGVTPTTGAIPTRATAGAMALVNPGGGRQKWLMTMSAGGSINALVVLYDRLYHCGGLSGTSTSVQTPAAAALTRFTNGVGNRVWVETYTALGGTNSNAVINYVNQAGNAAVSPSFPIVSATIASAAGFMCPMPFADGDSGVQSVTNIQLSASTGTAGNFGITIGHPLAVCPMQASTCNFTTQAILENVEVPTDACLSIMAHCGASFVNVNGLYMLGEK